MTKIPYVHSFDRSNASSSIEEEEEAEEKEEEEEFDLASDP